MNQYWIILNGVRLGPLSLDEVMQLPLTPDTPVWHAGLRDWSTAAALPEFIGRFDLGGEPCPPPHDDSAAEPYTPYYESNYRENDTSRMPRTYLAWAIVATLLCCIPTGIVAIIYASRVSSKYMQGDYYGSQRASQNALTWIIVSAVCGLIAIPFQIASFLL